MTNDVAEIQGFIDTMVSWMEDTSQVKRLLVPLAIWPELAWLADDDRLRDALAVHGGTIVGGGVEGDFYAFQVADIGLGRLHAGASVAVGNRYMVTGEEVPDGFDPAELAKWPQLLQMVINHRREG